MRLEGNIVHLSPEEQREFGYTSQIVLAAVSELLKENEDKLSAATGQSLEIWKPLQRRRAEATIMQCGKRAVFLHSVIDAAVEEQFADIDIKWQEHDPSSEEFTQ